MTENYVKAVELVKSISTSSVEVLAVNPLRNYVLLVNDSDTIIYISLGDTATVNRGIRLGASGGAYEINATNLYKGRISAISSAASKNLLIEEW